MNVIRRAVLALSLCTLLPVAAQDPNRFESAAAGFSLNKPAGWRFVSTEQVARSRANTRLSDAEMQKYLEQGASAPLVALIKDQPSSAGVDPNVQVTLRPLPAALVNLPPLQILELVLPALQKGFPDFALVSPIRELELSGRKAAEYVATYTLQTKLATKKGTVFPVRGRTILIPRGNFIFFIGMVGPAEGGDRAQKDFEKILSSITIAD